MDRAESGSKGGRATLKRHGREHFRELGRKGIRATAEKYFDGSISETMEWLRRRGTELQIAALLDAKLDATLQHHQTACVEMPVICDPDNDASFWTDRVRDRPQTARDTRHLA